MAAPVPHFLAANQATQFPKSLYDDSQGQKSATLKKHKEMHQYYHGTSEGGRSTKGRAKAATSSRSAVESLASNLKKFTAELDAKLKDPDATRGGQEVLDAVSVLITKYTDMKAKYDKGLEELDKIRADQGKFAKAQDTLHRRPWSEKDKENAGQLMKEATLLVDLENHAKEASSAVQRFCEEFRSHEEQIVSSLKEAAQHLEKLKEQIARHPKAGESNEAIAALAALTLVKEPKAKLERSTFAPEDRVARSFADINAINNNSEELKSRFDEIQRRLLETRGQQIIDGNNPLASRENFPAVAAYLGQMKAYSDAILGITEAVTGAASLTQTVSTAAYGFADRVEAEDEAKLKEEIKTTYGTHLATYNKLEAKAKEAEALSNNLGTALEATANRSLAEHVFKDMKDMHPALAEQVEMVVKLCAVAHEHLRLTKAVVDQKAREIRSGLEQASVQFKNVQTAYNAAGTSTTARTKAWMATAVAKAALINPIHPSLQALAKKEEAPEEKAEETAA